MLPELFDHQDQNVRASSKGLTLELCRWIGKDPVKSILFEKMRDTMVQKNYSLICMIVTVILPIHYNGHFFPFVPPCSCLKKKELEAELVNVTGTAKPSRKIR